MFVWRVVLLGVELVDCDFSGLIELENFWNMIKIMGCLFFVGIMLVYVVFLIFWEIWIV